MPEQYRAKLKLCDCGCGKFPRGGDFMPGHEVNVIKALVGRVGSLRNLCDVVEMYTGKPVNMNIKSH